MFCDCWLRPPSCLKSPNQSFVFHFLSHFFSMQILKLNYACYIIKSWNNYNPPTDYKFLFVSSLDKKTKSGHTPVCRMVSVFHFGPTIRSTQLHVCVIYFFCFFDFVYQNVLRALDHKFSTKANFLFSMWLTILNMTIYIAWFWQTHTLKTKTDYCGMFWL